VAEVTDAPADHWEIAELIPADIRGRLSKAELRARCAHAAEHYRIAEFEPERAGYLWAHAGRVLCSIPVVDYIREQRILNGLRRESADDAYLPTLRNLKARTPFRRA